MRALAFLLVFVVAAAARADEAVLLDRVAARVDDKVILLSDVLARAHPSIAAGEDVQRASKQALGELVDEALVSAEAKRLKLAVTDDEMARAREAIMKQNNLDAAQLDAAIAAHGATHAQWEAQVRQQLLEGKWLETALAGKDRPTDEKELNAWIQKMRDELVGKLRAAAYVDVRP